MIACTHLLKISHDPSWHYKNLNQGKFDIDYGIESA
jgi:hypothetical protein